MSCCRHLRLLLLICYGTGYILAIRKYSRDDVIDLREQVRGMFQHAYDGYLKYAYPYDELRPLSCDGVDTWGSYSLTLIDALDTLAIMGNFTEFRRIVRLISARENFDANINVSVFETNIRLVGGLLSAHLLSNKAGVEIEPGWPCNGPLLRLAEDAAQRLIAAFDTPTGMPYGTVNLRHGVPTGETSITCTAGIGTFIIEFGTLSRLTGDPIYEEVAMHALRALYDHRSPIGLLGNHVDVLTGRWVAQDSGIGAGIDSYLEYLVKGAILFQKPELMDTFNEARSVIDKYLKVNDGYFWGSMTKGQLTLPIFQSLESYWPGILSLIGDTDTAMRIVQSYHSVWKQYGFTPEEYKLVTRNASPGRESYPLRPELIESIMYLYRDTRDPILLQMGEDILRSIQHSARTECGYATIKDVKDHRKEDRMESFFLSETTKYLYLLFDPDNFMHNSGHSGTIFDTPTGECILDVGGYIFNTEAHPIDPAALHCCHRANERVNLKEVDDLYKYFQEEEKLKNKSFKNEKTKNSEKQESLKVEETPVDENITTPIDETSTFKNETLNFASIPEAVELDKNKSDESSLPKNVETVGLQFNEINKDKETINPKGETITAAGESPNSKKTYPLNISVIDYTNVSESSILSKKTEEKPIPPPLLKDKNRSPVSIFPGFVQGLLSNSMPSKTRCEPQSLLERIRKEKLYPQHPATQEYQLLQSPAPSFLRRISLAGEFVISN